MGRRIVAISQAPLGKRVLSIGNRGRDVLEAQRLLADSGFYHGEIDGSYGVLTEEAVLLFQKTYNLKSDGLVGSKSLAVLKAVSARPIRMVYTVKPDENLKTISKKFGVAESAWQSLPGQGNPQRKIYPGMKLLLNQKVVLCSGKKTKDFPATAGMDVGWEIGADSELLPTEKTAGSEDFKTVTAQPEVWKKVLASDKDWGKIVLNLKGRTRKYWGIDLRNAPPETIFRWYDLLYYLSNALAVERIPFIVIPLPIDEKVRQKDFSRLDLFKLSKLAKLLIIEPYFPMESPEVFLKSGANLARTLRKIINYQIGLKTLLMGRVGGWDWNYDQGMQCRPVSFREARLLTAMHHRNVKYDRYSSLTVAEYLRHQERHCLIFRDRQGWQDWIKTGVKLNLLGFAIQDPKDLGKFGNELIIGSFKVLPQDWL